MQLASSFAVDCTVGNKIQPQSGYMTYSNVEVRTQIDYSSVFTNMQYITSPSIQSALRFKVVQNVRLCTKSG